MAAEQAAAAHQGLSVPAAQEQGLPPQIKVEEEEEDNRVARGLRVLQARSLRGILRWGAPERVKQEPEEELPRCWEGQAQEHLKLVQAPHTGWGSPKGSEEFLLRPRGGKRREQQVKTGELGCLRVPLR